jgi:hypothetical protein
VRARVGSISRLGRVIVDRAVCDHVLASVIVLEERRYSGRRKGGRKSRRGRRIRVE